MRIWKRWKNLIHTSQIKYENVVEPFHTRFSYFFNILVISCQVFILFQYPCHKLPDFHTYSISFSKLANFSYFFSLLVKICQIFILIISILKLARFACFFSLVKICQIVILFQSSQMAKKWAQLKKFKNLILNCLIPSEPERAAEARRAVVASAYKNNAYKKTRV